MNITALTSVMAGLNTSKLIDELRRQGVEPVIVTEKANRHRLRRVLKKKYFGDDAADES